MIACNPQAVHSDCHEASYGDDTGGYTPGGPCTPGFIGRWVFSSDWVWSCGSDPGEPSWCVDAPFGCDWNPCEVRYEAVMAPDPVCPDALGCCWKTLIDGSGRGAVWCCTSYATLPSPPTECPTWYSWSGVYYDCVLDDPGGTSCPAGYTWSNEFLDCIDDDWVEGEFPYPCTPPSAYFLCGAGAYWEPSAPGANKCRSLEDWYIANHSVFFSGPKRLCAGLDRGYRARWTSGPCQNQKQSEYPVYNSECSVCVDPFQSVSGVGVCRAFVGPDCDVSPERFWSGAACGCVPVCPDGYILSGGCCIDYIPPPPCYDELNCYWDEELFQYFCDDPPECDEDFRWSWRDCECVSDEYDDSIGLDSSLDVFSTRYLEFTKSSDPDDPGLYIKTYWLNNAGPGGRWALQSTSEIVEEGYSPSIIKQRDDTQRLAWVGPGDIAYSCRWDEYRGAREVQTIATNTVTVNHLQDHWGRIIFAVFADDWYVVVGLLQRGTTELVLSAPVRMVNNLNEPANGAPAQSSLVLLADGSILHAYVDVDGETQHRMCRQLNNDGTGTWN